MNLQKYAARCGALASELIDSLSLQDRAALDKWFAEHDQRAWWAWREAHEETVAAYVSATAAQRARKRRWSELQPLLTWAAAQHCLEARALLHATDGLQSGCSYRDMAALAGQAYQELMRSPVPEWTDGDLLPSCGTPFVAF